MIGMLFLFNRSGALFLFLEELLLLLLAIGRDGFLQSLLRGSLLDTLKPHDVSGNNYLL